MDNRKEKTLNLNFHQDLFGDFYALMIRPYLMIAAAADAFRSAVLLQLSEHTSDFGAVV